MRDETYFFCHFHAYKWLEYHISIFYFKIKLEKLIFWFITVHNLVVSSRLDATRARDFRTVPEDLKILSIDDKMGKKRVVYGQNWGKIF